MTTEHLLQRISVDPDVSFGRPCVRGTRIGVSLVLDWLAAGWTTADVLRDYPQLTEQDVRACIAYAAEIARDRYLEVPGPA
ncbi:MAG: DUF433 domain-containing protein [Dehalococcoidia bacterium]